MTLLTPVFVSPPQIKKLLPKCAPVCPVRGLGIFPLVCKRVAERSRVEILNKSLRKELLYSSKLPPKRYISPAAVAVAQSE
jgi:hypothetical protein